ncbi:DUF397 domain-containing protein [Streptomyces sp. NPDC002536]
MAVRGPWSNSIQVADGIPALMPVRDSKNLHGPTLIFKVGAWSAFVTGVKEGVLAR